MSFSSCIFTVIKDEHDYLDFFIRYHLDLGIDHLFIFEDIGSLSHVGIVNRYDSDRVSLQDTISSSPWRPPARWTA